MNYINYIKHSLYDPEILHRRFDIDVAHMKDSVQRTAVTALPFIALYRPAGCSLSLLLNTTRSVSLFQETLGHFHQGQKLEGAASLGKTIVAVLSLATIFFHFTSALLITTLYDLVQSISYLSNAVLNREGKKALEELFQAVCLSAYFLFIVTGSLEAMVVFALFQGCTALSQAHGDFTKGRYIEGTGKCVMAALRLRDTKNYLNLISKRNAFLQLQRTRSVLLRILSGKKASHLIHHPLSSLKEQIESNKVILEDASGKKYEFGAHFHGNGQNLVKGENLTFRTLVVDNREVIELDFKVNHAFRDDIESALQDLTKLSKQEIRDLLSIAGSHATDISVASTTFPAFNSGVGAARTVSLDGLGTVSIGSDKESLNLYDRVVVRMDAKKNLYELHELLSLLNLDQAIRLSRFDDIERLKIGHLFRTFCPKEATPFERTTEFFTLPLDQLKDAMIAKAPQMKDIFAEYYPKMKEGHILDGKVRYQIEGLAQEAYNKGARALTAAMTGAYNDKELYQRVISILKMGMLATEVRHENNMVQHGLGGWGMDYVAGGADSVFTQLITEHNCAKQTPFSSFAYQSKVRLLFSLDVLETGTYQYHYDSFGNRLTTNSWFGGTYKKRDNILDFIAKEQQFFYWGNEVMIKERVDPSYIKALIVPDEQTKADLIRHLTEHSLVQNNTILGKPIEQFIRVSKVITEDLVS